MEQYKVTGMSCAACVARVEKAVQSVPCVDSVAVSLLTNSMSVEGDASPSAIEKAVSDAGYGASPLGGASDETARNSALADAEEMLKDTETPKLLRRLVWSVALTLLLMYFSMGLARAAPARELCEPRARGDAAGDRRHAHQP